MTVSVVGRSNPIQYQGSHNQRWGHVSFSQHGEDIMIVNLFEQLGVDKPSYLDLGAHHPIEISNTYLLYLRGSRGITVEANPWLMGAFQEARPEDFNITVGVKARGEPCELPFHMFHDVHGCNSFSEDEIERLENGGWRVEKTLNLRCESIADIITQYCPKGKFPDFVSCDLEGLDFEVMEACDFEKQSAPMILCIETKVEEASAMTDMMAAKGFSPYCRMFANVIYVRNDKMAILNEKLGAF